MTKYNTLSELNAFLAKNKNSNDRRLKSEDDYINQKPNDLVMNDHVSLEESIKENIESISTESVAYMINELAKLKGKSYTEMCLELFEKGSEITPVIKGGGVVTTWLKAHKTAYNVIKNTLKKGLD